MAQSIRERALGGGYPWHHQIGTTIFWVGELPHRCDPGNLRSAWDPHWIANAPSQNVFYVALPYNDVLDSSHTKPEAATVVPWFSRDFVAERKHAADYVTDCLAAAARAPSSRPGRSFA